MTTNLATRKRFGFIASFFLALVMAGSALSLGCGEHHYYRVYDPYYSDYHDWNHNEIVYYHEWARDRHLDEHRDFRKLPPDEQKDYWTWRHQHGDRDHDRDDHR